MREFEVLWNRRQADRYSFKGCYNISGNIKGKTLSTHRGCRGRCYKEESLYWNYKDELPRLTRGGALAASREKV